MIVRTMNARRRLARRVVPALVAALVLVGAEAPPAAAHHEEIPQPFFADVRSACTYGWTEGYLAWKAWHPPDTPGVTVSGVVGDRPIPGCTELLPITFAEFRAFVGRTQVDRKVRQVGRPNPTPFSFVLTATSSTVPVEIDRVVIRVCRGFPPDFPAVCGPQRTYLPPRGVGHG